MIHGKEDADLIKDIISYMIIRETSTMQHYSDFVWNHLINAEKQWDDCKISELEKISVVKNSKDVYIRRYGLTKKQKKILGEFEVTESYINSVSDKINQRS